jgi:hypothetical protein
MDVLPRKLQPGRPDTEPHEAARVPLRGIQDLAARIESVHQSHAGQINEEITALIQQHEDNIIKNPRAAFAALKKLFEKDQKTANVASLSTPQEILDFQVQTNGLKRGIDLTNPNEDLGFSIRTNAPLVSEAAFSLSELQAATSALNSGRAVGPDGVPAEIFKLPELATELLTFVNRYVDKVIPPQALSTELVLLAKKGDCRHIKNCRAVALTNTFLKLVNRLFMARLRVIDDKMEPFQNGFRPHRGTLQQSIALRMVLDRVKESGTPLVALFIDFKQAFPSVSHQALRQALLAWKISDRFADAIMACYNDHVVTVRNIPGSYRVLSGVLQGDTVAPLLFVILLDAILHKAVSRNLGINPSCLRTPATQSPAPPITAPPTTSMTLKVFDFFRTTVTRMIRTRTQSGALPPPTTDKVPYLAFADDLCLLTHSTSDAETQLRALQQLARKCGLEVNALPGKTEFVARNIPAEVHIVDLDGVPITRVDQYTYLGTNPFDAEAALNSRMSKAWAVAHRLRTVWRSPVVKRRLKAKMFDIYVEPVFLYGLVLSTPTLAFARRIDRCHARLLRFCTGWQPEADLYISDRRHASTIIAEERVRSVGHALRHWQPLAMFLEGVETPSGRFKTLERKIKAEIGLHETGDASNNWRAFAEDRLAWRRLVKEVGTNTERAIRDRLKVEREKRWLRKFALL